MMITGLFEDFNKVKKSPSLKFEFHLQALKKIWDNYSNIFKGEDHGDRISYPIYYGGFEGTG